MGILTKKRALLIGLLVGIGWLIWLVGGEEKQKPIGPMEFIPILPSAFHEGEMGSLPYREDFFAIRNIDRSDSAALLHAVAQHACQVADTINLRKYSLFRIEYYEHGTYMNDSTYHNNSRPLWHSADDVDAFAYWIDYENSRLKTILWFKSGQVDNREIISINQQVKLLFNQCHKRK